MQIIILWRVRDLTKFINVLTYFQLYLKSNFGKIVNLILRFSEKLKCSKWLSLYSSVILVLNYSKHEQNAAQCAIHWYADI